MRVLVTGRGTSGSWAVRGEQLGTAIGAKVAANASQEQIDSHDLIILVKRARPDLLERLRGRPVVYDVLDSWPQPHGNAWAKAEALQWLRGQIKSVRPIAIVAATEAMAADCEEFGVPVLTLPHHPRPKIQRNPIRDRITTVGYEGGEAYLGRWRKFLDLECTVRGWRFVVNPEHLSDLDIVVALRDCNGYAPRHYKSNIKLANAQGSGTPCVLNREYGYVETASGAEHWAETQMDVQIAFDRLESQAARREASAKLLQGAPVLHNLAVTYCKWLAALKF